MSIHERIDAALSPPRPDRGAPLINPDMRILNARSISAIGLARRREAPGAGHGFAVLRRPGSCAKARAVKHRSVLDGWNYERKEVLLFGGQVHSRFGRIAATRW